MRHAPLFLAGGLVGLGALLVVSRGWTVPGQASSSPRDLDPHFRARADKLFQALRDAGHDPVIRETWRSLERQAYYKSKGWSQVSSSFHTVTNADGTPAALALDFHDRRWRPDSSNQVQIYAAARQLAPHFGLRTGGDFAQTDPQWAPFGLGWDPGHVEPELGLVSIADANAGARPWEG